MIASIPLIPVGFPGEKDPGVLWFIHDEPKFPDKTSDYLKTDCELLDISGNLIVCPKQFETMQEFFEYLNIDEEYSLQFINDHNGIIELINSPTPKQKRLHAIKWKI